MRLKLALNKYLEDNRGIDKSLKFWGHEGSTVSASGRIFNLPHLEPCI